MEHPVAVEALEPGTADDLGLAAVQALGQPQEDAGRADRIAVLRDELERACSFARGTALRWKRAIVAIIAISVSSKPSSSAFRIRYSLWR